MEPSVEAFRVSLARCCQELLSDYGVRVAPSDSHLTDPPMTKLGAAIEFDGAHVSGTVRLWATRGVLAAVHRQTGCASAPVDELNALNLELVNQLASRLKNRLRAKGVSFKVGLPHVEEGVPDPRDHVMDFTRFVCMFGTVRGMVEVEIAPGLVLSERPPDSSTPREGDLVLF